MEKQQRLEDLLVETISGFSKHSEEFAEVSKGIKDILEEEQYYALSTSDYGQDIFMEGPYDSLEELICDVVCNQFYPLIDFYKRALSKRVKESLEWDLEEIEPLISAESYSKVISDKILNGFNGDREVFEIVAVSGKTQKTNVAYYKALEPGFKMAQEKAKKVKHEIEEQLRNIL